MVEKIKVLHIITRLDPGGASTNTIETVARLNRDRYEVFLISGRTVDPDGRIEAGLKAKGIAYVFFPDLQRTINPWKDLKSFVQLYSFMKHRSFDIVHTHTSKAGIVGRWAAKCAGVLRIIHTPHGHVFYGYFNPFTSAVFVWIERLTALITDTIITLTNRGKQEHINFKIAPARKFITIYSGIDLNPKSNPVDGNVRLKEELGIPADCFIFGSVARLDPIKGTSYLIKAMAQVVKKYPHSHLLLVGDGEERQRLEQQRDGLGLKDKATFTGFQKNTGEFMAIMDVFVLASLNEGMGRVILEAMVLGKPVIATRVGGVPELVEDDGNGFCVPPGDANALAQAMVKMIEDRELREQMGCQAKIMAGNRFSLDKMVRDIEHLYGIQ